MRNLVLLDRDNVTGLYSHLSRAFEIALLGGFTIRLVKASNVDDKKPTDNDLIILSELFDEVDFTTEEYGLRDLEKIHLNLEISVPHISEIISNRISESVDLVVKRSNEAKSNVLPEFKLSEAGRALLSNAYSKLDNIDLIKLDSIIQISRVIAQLHNSKEIKLEYLAEAIQYHTV